VTATRDPRAVRSMFGAIARRYDLLNHLLSANRDRAWRRAAARAVPAACRGSVLDLCGGTGEQSLALAREPGVGRVVCCDFAHAMLRLALSKFAETERYRRCVALEADALSLPFPEACFDAVTVSFGVRNLADLDAGLGEIHRVLKPGGCLVVLEFSLPTAPLVRRMYAIYLGRVLPRIGDRLSGADGAYGYLARTVGEFPPPEALAARITAAGFGECTRRSLSLGVVALHRATRLADARLTLHRAGARPAPSARGAGSPLAGR
jgi:demethylmenaquinone methyltransferase/2-methoxy-6-polyprenyl-1,4-benzoquinol methylase